MKSAFLLAVVVATNLYAQSQTQSANWIDLSNKSDAEITRVLEREIAVLAESPAAEAGERVQLLQMQEKTAKQSFDQKTVLLEGEFSTSAAAKEAAEKAFGDLQTDSTALATQVDLHERSRQRLRERLDKFPFKAVIVAKAAYSSSLELVKEKMLYDAGRLAIEQVNGVQIISETLVKNGVLVSDIIQAAIEGKADCQPREWKTLESGTQRVIYLYGLYDIHPLSEGVKLSRQAAQLSTLVETSFIKNENEPALAKLPANIQQEIRSMLATAEQANSEVRNNLSTLIQQEMQLLRNSGVTENKNVLQNKFTALRQQMAAKRLDLTAKRQAYESARKKFWDYLNSEQRIEIVTQFDFERNRMPEVIKAKLMSECLTQFRTTVKTLYSQEKETVSKSMLVASSSANMFKQVRLQGAKVLGIYLSPSEGDIKYTASVAFRFGFEYAVPTRIASSNLLEQTSIVSAGDSLIIKVMNTDGFPIRDVWIQVLFITDSGEKIFPPSQLTDEVGSVKLSVAKGTQVKSVEGLDISDRQDGRSWRIVEPRLPILFGRLTQITSKTYFLSVMAFKPR
jgi:hypothetical protein